MAPLKFLEIILELPFAEKKDFVPNSFGLLIFRLRHPNCSKFGSWYKYLFIINGVKRRLSHRNNKLSLSLFPSYIVIYTFVG